MILTANTVQAGLCWAVAAFSIATVVLAVDQAKLDAELAEARAQLDYLEAQLQGEAKPRAARSPDDDNDDEIDYRLPSALYPTHYELWLHPDTEAGTFVGHETIHVAVAAPTSQVTLHAHKLQVDSVEVPGQQVLGFELDTVREFLVIQLAGELAAGDTIEVSIGFQGSLVDKIVGFYSSTYSTEEGERRWIATSKFEPTYARQAFPCFDEPALKATFQITVVRPTGDGYHALSNMNEEASEELGVVTAVRFAKSVPMSTYLACFIVSDFAHEARTVQAHGVGADFEVRIFATAHQLDKVAFARDTAVAVTEFYIQYFRVEYPLPKLDMAAIPDFVSNAMEHWGLVTYRETALLYDRSFSSTWNKQRVAAVIAHELAHMWFGNLVTMMWWNDLWLNEGFARYMEYKGVNEVYPDWGMPDQFLVHALHSVMKYDASVASHPIVQTVVTPDQITEIFDTISYEKGASVIRMLEDVVGADQFERAVTNYLIAFQYANAVTDDFIGELAKLGLDFDVRLMMRTWTEQMGLPVVRAERVSETEFRLTQRRFLANPEDYGGSYDDSPFNYSWTIPVTYRTDLDDAVQRLWLEHDAASATVRVPAAAKWVKLNSRQVGFYRVDYDAATWRELGAHLAESPETFSTADRAHLLNDAFALADASQLAYDVALDMTRYLEQERAFVPWSVAASQLQALQARLMATETYVAFLRYGRGLLAELYAELSWAVDEDDHLRNRLRVSVLTAACALGLPECVAEAAARFGAWLEAPDVRPEPDLREIVYYYGMQAAGSERAWEQVWGLFLAEQDASEKLKLMYGLSGVQSPWLLHRFLELAEDEELVRRQDYFTCVQNIAANRVGEPVVWDYVREHWPALVERFGLNERYLGRMIPAIAANFATQTRLEEMQQFFAKYPEAGAGTASRLQALETVRFNVQWLAANLEPVAAWLAAQTAR